MSFSNYKKFENVGIRSSNDTLIVMDSSNNNISLHSSDGGDDNVDTLSIKNIINKTPNMDLNLSSLNGTTINPVITINNNNGDCRIMTNLNVNGNINLTNGSIKTTGIGSFGSIHCGVGTFTSINSGSGIVKTTGIGSFGSIHCGVGTFTSIDSGSGIVKTTGQGSFSSIHCGVGTFTSINSGSGMVKTTGIGSFGSIHCGVGTFTSIDSGSGIVKTTGIGSFGSIHCGVGTFTTADINGGTIDNVTIGGTGTWNGTPIAINKGGTGASDPSTARSNLGLKSLATLDYIDNSNWSGTKLSEANGGSPWTRTGSYDLYRNAGNVGLGGAPPGPYKLDVLGGDQIIARFRGYGDSLIMVERESTVANAEIGYVIRRGDRLGYWGICTNDDAHLHICHSSDNGPNFEEANNETIMKFMTDGRVGINVDNPDAQLHVIGSYISNPPNARYVYFNGSTIEGNDTTHNYGNEEIAIKYKGFLWGYDSARHIQSSDRRIKTNIIDVPDNLALQQLRSIPCRYYEYIDKITRGSDKTIGFIAQEVKEVLPMAVSLQTTTIPDVFKIINCIWTSSGDKFNMSSSDLPNVSGITYQFFVHNENEDIKEKEIEVIGNNDNTFTFDKKYNNVFCYGRKVDDFHTLEKNKLFTLNFSATQEIDRIQQTHITEIASLKIENQQQQTKINTLETEVSTLKTENAELKSIIDKLKTANSFEEFKNSL